MSRSSATLRSRSSRARWTASSRAATASSSRRRSMSASLRACERGRRRVIDGEQKEEAAADEHSVGRERAQARRPLARGNALHEGEGSRAHRRVGGRCECRLAWEGWMRLLPTPQHDAASRCRGCARTDRLCAGLRCSGWTGGRLCAHRTAPSPWTPACRRARAAAGHACTDAPGRAT